MTCSRCLRPIRGDSSRAGAVWRVRVSDGSVENDARRAFELASSGKVASVTHLRAQLQGEGYVQQQIEGPALGRQLRKLIAKATVPRGGLVRPAHTSTLL
jgi:hypothetical protein